MEKSQSQVLVHEALKSNQTPHSDSDKMTRITRLVMHGFKSFARRTELLFGDNFNCVVGPNGSGKSNVIDALCFVLGRSSAKALRAEKSQNLIYNGGKTRDPSKSAEVSIFFDNKAKKFPLESEEVKVSRIVKGSGQSVYKLNDKTCTRQQILELMSLARIDPEGYNIILQGDIIKFVEMQPEDRRKLIEEIAGISIYEDKKQKAMNELGRVEERIKEADIVLAERDTYLKELKSDRDQAVKYTEFKNKIDKSKGTHVHLQIERKQKDKAEIDEKIAKHREEVNEIQSKIDEHKRSIQERKAEIDSINKEIESKGEKEQLQIHKNIEHIRVDIASSKNRIDMCKNELSRIKQRKEQLENNQKEILEKIKRLESEKKTLEGEFSVKEKEMKEMDRKISEFRKNNEMDSIIDLEKEMDSLDKNAESKQKEIELLRQKQQEMLRNKDRAEIQIQAIDDRMEKVLEVEKENADQIKDLKRNKEDFKKATIEVNQLIAEDSSFASQLQTARGKLNSATEEMAKLRARAAAVQETLARDSAVRTILENRSKLKGVHGMISELAKVSSKYALALEVSAGTRIKAIVVENDKVAADCINFLKEKKAGVATFLPLNKMQGRPVEAGLRGLAKEQGAHGFAIDLIQFDSKFKPAFEFIFGNTLIVDDIESARKIGIGRVRIATLEGDLAETSGAMQGGFRAKAQTVGLFQDADLAKNIDQLDSQMADLQTVVSSLEKKRSSNEEKITRLRELKANLEGDIIKLEKSLHLDSEDMEASKKVRSELQSELKSVEKQITGINDQVSDVTQEITKAKIKRQELRNKVSELRNPAMLAELNAFEEKRREVQEKHIQVQSDIRNIGMQITNILLPEKENILKIIKQHDKESETFDNEWKSLVEKVKQGDADLKEKEKSEKEFMEKFKGLFARRQKIDEEIDKHGEKIESSSENLKKAEQKVNNVAIDNARISAELAGLNKEFEPYQGIELFKSKTEQELRKEISEAENFLQKMGNVNMRALEIYERAEIEFNELVQRKDKLKLEKEDVLVMMNEIEAKKRELFLKTFEVVNGNFKGIFSALSTKGEADLVIENAEDPFAGGVLIKVNIVGNKFLDIRSLSGGEKTMTALAFIFAIQEHEPASFYVLDEVDAALDKRNSDKLAKLVRKYSEKAQYIMISHNDGIISEADNLYGVAMDEHGVSNTVSLKI